MQPNIACLPRPGLVGNILWSARANSRSPRIFPQERIHVFRRVIYFWRVSRHAITKHVPGMRYKSLFVLPRTRRVTCLHTPASASPRNPINYLTTKSVEIFTSRKYYIVYVRIRIPNVDLWPVDVFGRDGTLHEAFISAG